MKITETSLGPETRRHATYVDRVLALEEHIEQLEAQLAEAKHRVAQYRAQMRKTRVL